MAAVNCIVDQQQDLFGSISKSLGDLKKLGENNISRGEIALRIARVKSYWTKFQANHERLSQLPADSRTALPYFTNDLFSQCEVQYHKSKAAMLTLWDKQKATSAAAGSALANSSFSLPHAAHVNGNIPMPPMPSSSMPAYTPNNQQQYENLMNNDALVQTNASSVTVLSGERESVNMSSVKLQSEVVDKSMNDELREAFKKVSEMTLIDDEDMLYTLYMKHFMFEDVYYTYNLLMNLYKKKYPQLYSMYRSVSWWTSFVLLTLLKRNESILNKMCNSTMCIPVVSASFEIMRRPNLTRRQNLEIVHPFKRTQYFQNHKNLFSLGTMTEYCVPTEFATLCTNAAESMMNKMIRNNEKEYKGIRGTFTRPIVAFIQKRNIQFMDSLGRMLSSMTGMKTENEIFNFETKVTMTMEDLCPNESSKNAQENRDENGSYIAILHSFQCFATNAKTLDIRSDADTLYFINNSVNISDDDIRLSEERAGKKFRTGTLERGMDRYNALLSKNESSNQLANRNDERGTEGANNGDVTTVDASEYPPHFLCG